MHTALQVLVFSVMLGGFYALMSQGLAISFGVMRFPNLAHGDLVVCGEYTNWLLSRALNVDGLVTIPLTMLIAVPVGWLVSRALLVPLLDKSHFVQLLVSLGLSLLIESGLILAFSAEPARIVSTLSSDVYRIGWLSLPGPKLFMLGAAVVLIGALTAVLKWSTFGKMMRATADNLQAATTVGIPVRRVFVRSFELGTVLSFAAGAIMGIDQAFLPASGLVLTLKCFVVVIVGGHSRIAGTVVAAMALALIETASGAYVPQVGSSLGIVLGVVLLAVILMVKPSGLLGRATERAQAG